MRIRLEFFIEDILPIDDLDELSLIIREAIDEKLGETEYMVQDIGLDYEIEA